MARYWPVEVRIDPFFGTGYVIGAVVEHGGQRTAVVCERLPCADCLGGAHHRRFVEGVVRDLPAANLSDELLSEFGASVERGRESPIPDVADPVEFVRRGLNRKLERS